MNWKNWKDKLGGFVRLCIVFYTLVLLVPVLTGITTYMQTVSMLEDEISKSNEASFSFIQKSMQDVFTEAAVVGVDVASRKSTLEILESEDETYTRYLGFKYLRDLNVLIR